jgi:inner membrane protein
VICVTDLLLHVLQPPYPELGLLDEPAHLATATLVALVLPPRAREFVVPLLVMAVAIDLDHLPGELGVDALTMSSQRPVTHSIGGIAIVAAIAFAATRRPLVAAGAACGVAAHLLRDLGVGGGVPLGWPLATGNARFPYAVYLAAAGALAAGAAIGRRSLIVERN